MAINKIKGVIMNASGRYVLFEFFDCSSEILNAVSQIENIMESAACEAGATVINSTFHHFSPLAVSGVVLIYLAYIPTYPTGMWSFAYSSRDKLHPLDYLDDVQAQSFANRHVLRYYSPAVHRAAFALPRFVQKMILDSMAVNGRSQK